jgi:hypothetical protein
MPLKYRKLEMRIYFYSLSAIMSSCLRDENLDIADLSDGNRPTKVGEQFSELYDSQWTDAYDTTKNFFENDITELEIIQILLEIVKVISFT